MRVFTEDQKIKSRIRSKDARNAKKAKGVCINCGKGPLYTTTRCKPCMDKHNLSSRKVRDKRRALVYSYYGGYCCVCCGESDPAFLTLDHINNDGAHMRRDIHGRGNTFLAWLKHNNYPQILQVLCANCQFGKLRNNGVCPHQALKENNL